MGDGLGGGHLERAYRSSSYERAMKEIKSKPYLIDVQRQRIGIDEV
jgi:hypothetical protein